MVKNSHSLQPKLSKNHHQNRAVEVASLSKRTSALRQKLDLSLDFQSKKTLNYLSSNFGSLHRPIPFPKISAISLQNLIQIECASAKGHQAQFTFKKIKHDLPFPSLPPQKYGLYCYSMCLRQVTRLSRIPRSELHPNSFSFPVHFSGFPRPGQRDGREQGGG